MLALPQTDLAWLKRRISNFSEDRPGVYRMMSPDGRVIYVGKAKKIRTRLLSYFRAEFPEDKAARILHAAADIQWEYVTSEFAALLKEMRYIQRNRPTFNVRMNRPRNTTLIKVSGGPAPKLMVGSGPGKEEIRHYGPFTSPARARDGVRTLNDLLGMRDCALTMSMTFAEQGDLFGSPSRAGCMRFEFGTCTGPCAGRVTAAEYDRRLRQAIDFLEGRSIAPLDQVIEQMTSAGEQNEFERAARWRERFESLEWLFQATVQARTAIESLSFVYFDRGAYGDDMAYLIRRATVRAAAPVPRTPIEREAFRAIVEEHAGQERDDRPLPASGIDEMLLLLSWFRRHPGAMRRTVPITEWLADPTLTPADLFHG